MMIPTVRPKEAKADGLRRWNSHHHAAVCEPAATDTRRASEVSLAHASIICFVCLMYREGGSARQCMVDKRAGLI